MLKLKLQHFDYLKWRVNSLEKTLILGKIEGKMIKGWQRLRWLDNITNSTEKNLSIPWEKVKDKEAWHACLKTSQSEVGKEESLKQVVCVLLSI